MAEVVDVRGAQFKVRNPLAPTLLPLITLGIYSIVWYYKVNKELKEYGAVTGDRELAESNPINSLLAVTIGIFALGIPAIISYIGFIGRLQRAERQAKREPIEWGLIGLIIIASFFTGFAGLALPYIEQQHLNGIWKHGELREGTAVAGLPTA